MSRENTNDRPIRPPLRPDHRECRSVSGRARCGLHCERTDLGAHGDYPASPLQLYELVRSQRPDDLPSLKEAIESSEFASFVFLSIGATDHLAAVELKEPPQSAAPGKPKNLSSKGFRPGRIPLAVALARMRSIRMPVGRVDQARSRLPKATRISLLDRRVMIIGCGSLGSGVARMLVLSGLGHLLLIDGETLSWANVGRHELGADAVGSSKSLSLAKSLKLAYPSVRSVEAYDLDVLSLPDLSGVLKRQDLILSLSGNWNAEVGLSDLMSSHGISTPVIYGWMERNAAAGHALAIAGKPGCLRCAFTATGSPILPATAWQTAQTDETCGDSTSPYSAIDLVHPQALISEFAIDILLGNANPPLQRSWLNSTAQLEAQGGSWHLRWKALFGDPGAGRIYTSTPFTPAGSCKCAIS